MSTGTVQPKPEHDTLREWARHNPHQIGFMRLGLFALGLVAAGVLGAVWANPAPPTAYNEQAQCDYAAARYDPPIEAMVAVVSQTFQINWKIQNTGSCHVWGEDVLLVRRNDDILSQATAYPAVSVPIFSAADNDNPVNGASVTTVMTAPTTSGVFVTEWTMRAPDGKRFGPIMQQRVQVVDQGVTPPPIPNLPPPSPGAVLFANLFSFVYHLLPALLGIIFILWGANGFLVKVFHLPTPTSGLAHIQGMLFGRTSLVLYVHQGGIDAESSDKAAQIIGGPAWLTVAEGNAVLLERGAGFSRIVGIGEYRLRPHERVRGIIDLRTHYRKNSSSVLTKDGIPVKMDVDLTFRVTEKDVPGDPPASPPPPLSPLNWLRRRLGLRVQHDILETTRPHRFSRETIRRLVYETAVMSSTSPPDWTMSFFNVRSGDITDQIANRRLDEISAPDDAQVHPRAEIARKGLEDTRAFVTKQAQGIDVLDMTLGVIEPQDKYPHIANQIIANWKIEWERRAKILEAKAAAKRTQLLEEARAEAQANMIQALTEGYRIAVADNPEGAKDIIALRIIDSLESLLVSRPPDDPLNSAALLGLLRGES